MNKSIYYVYKIMIGDKMRYVGYTSDIIMREKQHNYHCFKSLQKKILYNKIRTLHPDIKEIKLVLLKTFPSKVEAKRFECYTILWDYFNNKDLWQRVPIIKDR